MTQHANDSKSPEISDDLRDSTGRLDLGKFLEKTVKGENPEQAAYGRTDVISDDSAIEEFSEDVESSPLDILENELLEESDEQEQSDIESETSELSEQDSDSLLDSVQASSQPEEDNAVLDIETILVKGENGRKQKLKIDYADKKAIKQAYLKAAGMRKFQAERDESKTKLSEVQTKYDELNDTYTKLDSAFQDGGIKSVVELLGGPNAIDTFIDDVLKEREYVSNLTPDEKYKLDLEEREKSYQSQLTAEKSKREAFEKQVLEREEQAALRSLESKLHPTFDRYRFSGKLSDPIAEQQLDDAIWQQVTSRLGEYPEDIELTQSLIDKEFRTVSNNFKKLIKTQTEQKVKSTITKKKAEASQRAQVAAKKGLSSNADKRKFVQDMKSGNIKDAFGAMFTGKVKL
jgi:hypothetical protein